MTFEEELQKAHKKCHKAYAEAENCLNEITLLIQQKYPSLEATIAGDEIFYMDMSTPNRDEYYSLEDIKERYDKKDISEGKEI